MIFKVDYNYNNNIELLDTVILLYTETVLKKNISYKRRCVLREYIKSGYNAETKKAIRINLEISAANLNTINFNLQKAGLLVPHGTNQTMKLLNTELQALQEAFINSKQKKVFLIHFIENEVRR